MPSGKTFRELIRIIEKLRSPQGCPWDKKQTHKSLRPYLIEEAYEVLNAINADNHSLLKEELGDLLLQIVLHAQIAAEKKEFTIKDVVVSIKEKMVRRHPHVFAQKKILGVEQVWANWEKIKRTEKHNQNKSFFAGIPDMLPGLYRAGKVQKKAARIGFDWEKVEGALEKVEEEMEEFYEAYTKKPRKKKHLEEELGDVLFSLVNVARKLEIDPEEALRRTTDKFIQRFSYIEKKVKKQKKELTDCSLQELDKYWRESKKK